jgi:cell wall-associated NlpC family hydrolase
MRLRSALSLTYSLAALTLALGVTPARADDESLRPDLGTRLANTISSSVGSVMAGAQNLVLNAMGFLGIPYRFGGATPEAGFDCSGFVQYVFRQAAGLMLPRSSFDQIRQGIAVAREELQVGDLVFFNTMRATASHVGIYIGENRFIHAPSRGKTVEIVDIENSYWRARYDGARRLPL